MPPPRSHSLEQSLKSDGEFRFSVYISRLIFCFSKPGICFFGVRSIQYRIPLIVRLVLFSFWDKLSVKVALKCKINRDGITGGSEGSADPPDFSQT